MTEPKGQIPDILPRNIHFEFDPDLPRDWFDGDPAISRFYDSLSLRFPDGERFFIDSAKPFTPQLTDPEQIEAAKNFAAQESVHAREHAGYNRNIAAHGMKLWPYDVFHRWYFKSYVGSYPKKFQLAITCGVEHLTAMFSETILNDPEVMKGAHPFYQDVWRWHAIEEQEHKAAAFDIYQQVAPGFYGYLRRIFAMAFVTVEFTLMALFGAIYLMARSGELFNFKSWWRSFYYLWIKPGLWRKVVANTPAYYRPNFHPAKEYVPPVVRTWRLRYRDTKTHTPGNAGNLFAAE